MNFDFKEEFQHFTPLELLRIIRNPDDYQQGAVDAATLLLNGFSKSEIAEAERLLSEEQMPVNKIHEEIDNVKDKVFHLFEPEVDENVKVNLVKWVNGLLVIIAIQYLYVLWECGSAVAWVIRMISGCMDYGYVSSYSGSPGFWYCFKAFFDFATFIQVLMVLYNPIAFYLLLKRRKWGWILLFADNLAVLVLMSIQLLMLLNYEVEIGNPFMTVFLIILKSFVAYFLWKKDVALVFGVEEGVKQNAAMVAAFLAIALYISIEFAW